MKGDKMDVVKLNAKGIPPFMHLIEAETGGILENLTHGNPDSFMIGNGFMVYGLYNPNLKKAQGALVAQVAGTSVVIRSLFVDPFYSGFGGGTMLIEELTSDVFYMDNISEIEFLASSKDPSQMEVAGFLKSRGFESEVAEEAYYRVRLSEIINAGVLSKASDRATHPLKEASDSALRRLGNELVEGGDAFISLPIKKQDYDEDVSMVIEKDGAISDIVLVSHDDSGLILSYAYSKGSGMGIISALSAAVNRAVEKFGAETLLRIPTVTDVSKKIVDKIIPGARSEGYIRCYYSMLPLYENIYGREMELKNE